MSGATRSRSRATPRASPRSLVTACRTRRPSPATCPIITASPEWLLRPILERQGIAQRVDTIVLSSELGKRKPHRAIFERALGELGVDAEDALFVGDRLDADVVGASRLGMRTVQALWFRADDAPVDVEP